MRRIVIVSFAVLASAAGALTVLTTVPYLNEPVLRWTCPAPTPRCLVRMRSHGHLWSRWRRHDRAMDWYARGAEAGDRIAMFHLAWAAEQGAFADLKRWAREADARSHAHDREAPEDDPSSSLEATDDEAAPMINWDRAMYWYRRSADLGFAPAMNNLAQLYLHLSRERDRRGEAFRWHLEAARAGNPIAAMNVAIAYRAGQGIAPDAAAADSWSTWHPTNVDPADLAEPTLERTHLFGTSMPKERRTLIRASARAGSPVELELKPVEIKVDPSLPTFSQVSGAIQR
jgi:hypothetical protein